MKTLAFLICTVVLSVSLSACSNTRGERTLSGAAIGAGAGAGISAISGGSVGTGAAVGAAAGAITGAATYEDE